MFTAVCRPGAGAGTTAGTVSRCRRRAGIAASAEAMAGEYFRWKYRDVKPEEKRELTKAEKRKNWWDYHKWHVLIGVAAAICLGNLVWTFLGVGQVRPDYQIAYVGAAELPGETAAALEAALSELGEDLNGDGQTVVTLHQYATYAEILRQLEEEPGGAGSSDVATKSQVSQISLMVDIQSQDSFFFLLYDPESFRQSYQILSRLDGTLPEGGRSSVDGTCLSWEECPVLSGLELGSYAAQDASGAEAAKDSQELLSRLYIARRGFWTDETCDCLEGCEALWDKPREGV